MPATATIPKNIKISVEIIIADAAEPSGQFSGNKEAYLSFTQKRLRLKRSDVQENNTSLLHF